MCILGLPVWCVCAMVRGLRVCSQPVWGPQAESQAPTITSTFALHTGACSLSLSLYCFLSCPRSTVFCWWSLGVTCCVLKYLLTKKERWELPSPSATLFLGNSFSHGVWICSADFFLCCACSVLNPVCVHVWFSSAFHKLGWHCSCLVLLSPVVSYFVILCYCFYDSFVV